MPPPVSPIHPVRRARPSPPPLHVQDYDKGDPVTGLQPSHPLTDPSTDALHGSTGSSEASYLCFRSRLHDQVAQACFHELVPPYLREAVNVEATTFGAICSDLSLDHTVTAPRSVHSAYLYAPGRIDRGASTEAAQSYQASVAFPLSQLAEGFARYQAQIAQTASEDDTKVTFSDPEKVVLFTGLDHAVNIVSNLCSELIEGKGIKENKETGETREVPCLKYWDEAALTTIIQSAESILADVRDITEQAWSGAPDALTVKMLDLSIGILPVVTNGQLDRFVKELQAMTVSSDATSSQQEDPDNLSDVTSASSGMLSTHGPGDSSHSPRSELTGQQVSAESALDLFWRLKRDCESMRPEVAKALGEASEDSDDGSA